MTKNAPAIVKRTSRSQRTVAEKKRIKEKHADFVEKIQMALANEHQQAIFEAAQSGSGQYVVLALAKPLPLSMHPPFS